MANVIKSFSQVNKSKESDKSFKNFIEKQKLFRLFFLKLE